MSHPEPNVHLTRNYEHEMSVKMKRGGSLYLLAVGNNEECDFFWIPKKEGGKLYPVKDHLLVDYDEAAAEFWEYVAQQDWEADESAWEDHCERLSDMARERAA